MACSSSAGHRHFLDCQRAVILQPHCLSQHCCINLTGATIIRTLTKQRLAQYSRSLKQLEPHTNSLITNAIRGFLEVITFRASDAVRDTLLEGPEADLPHTKQHYGAPSQPSQTV